LNTDEYFVKSIGKELSIKIELKPVHPSKAYALIVFTDTGIVTVVRPVHLEKQLLGITESLAGKMIEVKLLQLAKA
jgi:hypothetical protein